MNNYPKIKPLVDLPENSSWSNRRLVVFHLSGGMFKRTKTCHPWYVLMNCCFRGHFLHSRAKYIWFISENVIEGLKKKSIGKWDSPHTGPLSCLWKSAVAAFACFIFVVAQLRRTVGRKTFPHVRTRHSSAANQTRNKSSSDWKEETNYFHSLFGVNVLEMGVGSVKAAWRTE